jgi:hypothetical protein
VHDQPPVLFLDPPDLDMKSSFRLAPKDGDDCLLGEIDGGQGRRRL